MSQKKSTPPVLLVQDDPLELEIKRNRYSRSLLSTIFRTPGSYLGKYSYNWMAAGALADMIEAIFTKNEKAFKERRKALRELGMNQRPQPLHFDVLRVIVSAFPKAVQRGEIQRELKAKYPDLTIDEVKAATAYLKEFTVKICGFSILPDFDGGVCLADIDARLNYHIHAQRTVEGIQRSAENKGLKALQATPDIRTLQSVSMPILEFAPQKEMADASD